MINFVNRRVLYLWISIILFIIAVVFLGAEGLKMGVQFSSGSELTLKFDQPVSQADLRSEVRGLGYTGAIVQETNEGAFIISTRTLTKDEKDTLEGALTDRFGPSQELNFDNVGPRVASETARTAIIAVAVACVGILIYVTWAFRRMPRPFHYGVCAVIALVHDTVIVMGVFAILGAVLGWKIDLMFITGILAVIGYSVNNVVVIFDRVRENLRTSSNFEMAVNNSLVETLGRSLNTSLTTLFTIVALMLFVGATIQNFVVALLVGVVIGVFSSIFVAPNLLVIWQKGEWRRLIPGLGAREASA
jgi:preprotein translocase subunit SecF